MNKKYMAGAILLIIGFSAFVGGFYVRESAKRDFWRMEKYEEKLRIAYVTFILGGISLIIGLILLFQSITQREKQLEKQICTECERKIPSDANLCPYCGTDLMDR
ncbi:MAG: zinc-ribbon domain-containing protein [Thermoplasmatota archaeon]